MKKFKALYTLLLLTGMVVSFTSCIKNDPYTDYSGIGPNVLIPNANWPKTTAINSTSVSYAADGSLALYKFNLNVRVSWEHTLDRDIIVTFAPSQKAVDEYNAAFGTKWTLMPASAYTVPSLKVTIPAGQNTTTNITLPVTIDPAALDLTKRNMFAFSISDASGETIATNFSTYVIPFTVKNKYDGNYLALYSLTEPTLQSTLTDADRPTAVGEYPRVYHLVTTGPDKVVLFDPALNDYAHYYSVGGAGSSYATFAPEFQFNLTTNKLIAVRNFFGQPTTTGVAAQLDPTATATDNVYVPTATTTPVKVKGVYSKYIMTVNGVDKVKFKDVFSYSAARTY